MHSALFLTLFLSAFSALAMALPIGIHGRATGARQFSAFTIANGVGGNALAEAKAAFPGTASTLSAAQTSAFNVRRGLSWDLCTSAYYSRLFSRMRTVVSLLSRRSWTTVLLRAPIRLPTRSL